MKPGEVVQDPDGSRWIIIGVYMLNGQKKANRVRVGSLAAKVLGYGDVE